MNLIAFPDHLAEAVSSRRARLGRTQEQLAQYGGPSSRAVCDIEAGRIGAITPTSLAKLDRGLDWAPGSAARILDGGSPDDTGEQWPALGAAVKARREQLRLPQDLVARGGPGEMTVRKIERAEVITIRNKTKTQLEHALAWPRGYVDELLNGTAIADDVIAEPPTTPSDDEDARALRIGRAVLALLRELEQT
jgi:hypothetical protein